MIKNGAAVTTVAVKVDAVLDLHYQFPYLPFPMQKAQGKCCENQPLSRNR